LLDTRWIPAYHVIVIARAITKNSRNNVIELREPEHQPPKMQSWISSYLVVSVVLVSTLVAAPFIVRFTGQAIGWYLRRRTSARKELILARVKVEEDDYKSKERRLAKSEDEEWERIDTRAQRTGENASEDWEGVIGFFHPFWYYTTFCERFQEIV